jgi:hypothetical protein
MNTDRINSRQIVLGATVAAAVVAANLIAAEPEDVKAVASTDVQTSPSEAPAPIVGVAAPDIGVSYSAENEIVVPAIRHVELDLPELPAIDLEAVRKAATVWLGDGVMATPDGAIEVEAPTIDVAASEIGPMIQVPVLERPSLPKPPAVR